MAIKETLSYLRGRTPESVIGELLVGVTAGGGDAAAVPIYESETAALRAELNGGADGGAGGMRPDSARVIVLMCHSEREQVFDLLEEIGARPVDTASELTELVPRLQERPRRDCPPQARGRTIGPAVILRIIQVLRDGQQVVQTARRRSRSGAVYIADICSEPGNPTSTTPIDVPATRSTGRPPLTANSEAPSARISSRL